MVAKQDYVIEQGEDLVIDITYQQQSPTWQPGDPEINKFLPVDLTGWNVRMDIVTEDGTAVDTFNNEDSDPTTDDEITLGADGKLSITIPRSLTLSPGRMFQAMETGVNKFKYDMFLRNPDGKQKKLLQGNITVNRSITLWD